MDVVDSTELMANGGVKDTEYLAKQFIPLMQKIDPQFELFDMVAFDHAANVQKVDGQFQQGSPKSLSFMEKSMYVFCFWQRHSKSQN